MTIDSNSTVTAVSLKPIVDRSPKRKKIMYVVVGVNAGTPHLERLHVTRIGNWSYTGWTDSGRHVQRFDKKFIKSTPKKAIEVALEKTFVERWRTRRKINALTEKLDVLTNIERNNRSASKGLTLLLVDHVNDR